MRTFKRTVQVLSITLFLSLTFLITPMMSTVSAATYNYQVLSGRHTVSGVQRALVILVEFQDVHHTKDTSDIKAVAIDQLNDYYSTVSRGKVMITGDVFGWYTANHPMSYYGHDSKSPGEDNNVRALAVDALSLLPTSTDLSPYNFLVVVHAGLDQADDKPGTVSDEIWSSCFCSVFPLYGSFTPISARSKTFAEYTFLSEMNGFGTYAHEWGHYFGLPDLYDTVNGDNYVGYWSLMDAGNWCCFNEDQTTPSDIGAWGDSLLGWITPSVADSNLVLSSFSMKPLQSPDPTAILIPISARAYYFIEYRTKEGIDSHLPESGMLIYYVDESYDTGRGIVKLVNPKTGTPYGAQAQTRSLNTATFHSGDQFKDTSHQVYVAFLGAESVSMLYSKQALTGTVVSSNINTGTFPAMVAYGDRIPINGSLLSENGMPLIGQSIEVDYLDPSTNQWEMIGSTVTGQKGEISLQVSLTVRVGDYRFRLLYPGGKTGDTWYSSSTSDFIMSVTPAIMRISVSFPKTVGPDRVIVEVNAKTNNGQPISGVNVEVFVDNVRKGIIQTDPNGRAALAVYFGFGDMGSHSITARAQLANYLPAENADNILVLPPLWLIGISAAVAVVAVVFVVRRRGDSKQTGHEEFVTCPKCGTQLPLSSAFCLSCGTSIPESSEDRT